MDELQARIRTRRSLQTDRNLAEQPYSEFEYSDDGQRLGEANVVEMPQRQAPDRQAQDNSSDSPPTQRSAARRKQGAAQHKPAIANQKAFSFRQMRDGHQQPYIDELKRLEAQAERINQLLAERKRKKAQAEQPERTAGETATPKKRSAKGSKPSSRSPQREVSLMPAQDDDTVALEAQAERIKQLLAELESAIVQRETLPASDTSAQETIAQETIAQEMIAHNNTIAQETIAQETIAQERGADRSQSSEQSPSATSTPTASVAPAASTYRYRANAPAFAVSQAATPEGDQKAQQEATETAQALRYLASRDASRDYVEPSIAPSSPRPAHRAGGRSRTVPPMPKSPIQRYGLQLRQWLQMPQTSFDKVGDAVLWLVMAAAMRVGARCLLALFPALSPVFMVLMFAPAVLAVYLVLCVPRTGFVSVYRLFLIMLGLLLGGRL